MCGRYVTKDVAALERAYRLGGPGHNPVSGIVFKGTYNAAPSQSLPIMRQSDTGPELALCKWGLIPSWAKTPPANKPINARAETVAEKPFFRTAFKRHRCLVPASGYYEWKRTEHGKQPYYIHLAGTELISFAGIWDRWENASEPLESFAIITTEANEFTRAVHDRMPVILDPGQYGTWLQDGGQDLLQPYAGALQSYPVSMRVNSPRNDGPDLIQPLPGGDSHTPAG